MTDGKVVLTTGASGGIDRAIATMMAEAGAKVIMPARMLPARRSTPNA
jgi:NAD(P)-dependent dehydrogenase (short-subunit alcohol dehydrogenase family)